MRVLPLLVHPTDRIKPSTFFSPPQCVQQCSEAKAIWESQPPLRGRCTNTSIVLQQKSLPLVVTPCVTVLATQLCTNTTRHEFRPVVLLTQRQQMGQSQILSIMSMCASLPYTTWTATKNKAAHHQWALSSTTPPLHNTTHWRPHMFTDSQVLPGKLRYTIITAWDILMLGEIQRELIKGQVYYVRT